MKLFSTSALQHHFWSISFWVACSSFLSPSLNAEADVWRYHFSCLIQWTGVYEERAPACTQKAAGEGFRVILAPRFHTSRQWPLSLEASVCKLEPGAPCCDLTCRVREVVRIWRHQECFHSRGRWPNPCRCCSLTVVLEHHWLFHVPAHTSTSSVSCLVKQSATMNHSETRNFWLPSFSTFSHKLSQLLTESYSSAGTTTLTGQWKPEKKRRRTL